MPRKKSNRNAIILLVLIIGAAAVIAWHDGLIGVTSIRDINQGDVASGTEVRIKGQVTAIIGNLMTVSDGEGYTLGFSWAGDKPALDSVVVVSGEVSSPLTLSDVSSVWSVWIFS